MAARTFLLMTTLFLLLVTLVVAGPARGSSQFNVRLSITSQCGSQPATLFGSVAQASTNVVCLPSSTLFSVRKIGFTPSAASQSIQTNGANNALDADSASSDGDSGQSGAAGAGSTKSGNAGAAAFYPSSIGILPSSSSPTSASATESEKVVYVVF